MSGWKFLIQPELGQGESFQVAGKDVSCWIQFFGDQLVSNIKVISGGCNKNNLNALIIPKDVSTKHVGNWPNDFSVYFSLVTSQSLIRV